MRQFFTVCGLVATVAFEGCGADCSGHVCDGVLSVDLSGEQPVFSLEGTSPGSEHPDLLTVSVPEEVEPCNTETRLWELEQIDEAGAITYGKVPDGARSFYWSKGPDAERLEGEPPALEEGVLYSASFSFNSSGLSDWDGYFVAGDPESFQLSSEFCE